MSKKTLTLGEKRAKAKRLARLDSEKKTAATRAKYGPAMKPSPVVVRRLDGISGEWETVAVVDQRDLRRGQFAASLEARARAAGFESYGAYLRSPHWLALRERTLDRDRHRCRRCGRRSDLQVHHAWYAPLGAEPLRSLRTLCAACHRKLHA